MDAQISPTAAHPAAIQALAARENPQFRSVAYIRFSDIAKSTGAREKAAEGPGEAHSLFSVLGLDPLTGLYPAVQEIAQTRQLGERSIFYFQRLPNLIDMQAERFTDQLATMPEAKSLVASVDRISLVGNATERMVQSLPETIGRERAALLSQLMHGLDERTAEISDLSGDLRSTLVAGTETANALHATLETADRITARYAKTDETSGLRFDIREYTQAAREVAAATHELSALTERADTVLPVMRQATDEIADRIKQIQDRLFLDLLLLVVAAIAASLLAALVYRAVVSRMQQHDTPVRTAR